MWLIGSSQVLPLNLGISNGNLVDIVNQVVSCSMGTLSIQVKSIRLRLAMNGKTKGIFPSNGILGGGTNVGFPPNEISGGGMGTNFPPKGGL
jgi:hypothetical protein